MFVTEDVCLPRAGQCNHSEFWNSDLDVCVPCSSCKMYPKTPSCNTCKMLSISRPPAAAGAQLRRLTAALLPDHQVNLWRSRRTCGSWQPSPASRCWPWSSSERRSSSGSWCTDANPTSGPCVVRRSGFTCGQTAVLPHRLLKFHFRLSEAIS